LQNNDEHNHPVVDQTKVTSTNNNSIFSQAVIRIARSTTL